MANVNGRIHLVYGSFVIIIKVMIFTKLEILNNFSLECSHGICCMSSFLGNRFCDSKISVVYWEVPSGTTSLWGDGSRDGKRENLICEAEASA